MTSEKINGHIQLFLVVLMLCALALLVMSGMFEKPLYVNSVTDLALEGSFTLDGGEEKPLMQLGRIPMDTYRTVVVTGHLPCTVPLRETLMFRLPHLYCDLSVNGEVLYSNTVADPPAAFRDPGNYWALVTVQEITPKDTLTFVFRNVYCDIPSGSINAAITSLCYGSEQGLLQKMMIQNWPSVIFGFALVAWSGLLLFLSLVFALNKVSGVRHTLQFGIICLFSGMWLCLDFNFVTLLIPYPVTLSTLKEIMQMGLVVFLLLYNTLYIRRFARLNTYAAVLPAILLMLVLVFLQLFGIADMYSMHYLYVIFVVLIVFSFILLGYEAIHQKHKQAWLVFVSMIPFWLGALAEYVSYLMDVPFTGIFYQTGFFIYMLLQCYVITQVIRRNQRRMRELNSELTQSRIVVMLSQIRPHFVYNVLNAISGLCLTQPEKAEEAIVDFSGYLRANIDSLQNDEPIRFSQELSHVRQYVELEKLRFEDRLNVVYNIGYSKFALPTLTLQPLVENAIKHGILQRLEGGTVTITTRLDEGTGLVVITVADDGIGFDPAAPPTVDPANKAGEPHQRIGVENVRKRLKYMVGGELSITSAIGKGTTVTLRLPLKYIDPLQEEEEP